MMTIRENDALPIPEEYKNTPNLYRLARFIASCEHCDKIMAALPLILEARTAQAEQKGGEKA